MHFSVVIPTHQRRQKLEQCLGSLGRQQGAPTFEVIIVFDGPEPEHEQLMRELMDRFHLHGQVLTQAQSGPATARNRGARAARGERILFLGDDVICDEKLLYEHARVAREHPGAAVVGYIPWARHIRVTRFMEYLAPDRGVQFNFGTIRDPNNCGYAYCFTPNFALPRAAWEAEPFDEAFKHAAGEDTEWSWRLHQRGLRIVFARDAVTWHDHPMSLDSYIQRQRRAGQAAALIWQKHPALRGDKGLFPDPAPFFFSPKGDSWRDKFFTLRLGLKHYLGMHLTDPEYLWLLARPYLGALHEIINTLPPGA